MQLLQVMRVALSIFYILIKEICVLNEVEICILNEVYELYYMTALYKETI